MLCSNVNQHSLAAEGQSEIFVRQDTRRPAFAHPSYKRITVTYTAVFCLTLILEMSPTVQTRAIPGIT